MCPGAGVTASLYYLVHSTLVGAALFLLADLLGEHRGALADRLVPGPLATTDDRGVYRIAYLRPGRFFIAVLSVQATVPYSPLIGSIAFSTTGLNLSARSQAAVSGV